MRKIFFYIIFMLIIASGIAYAVLPNDLWSRIKDSFVETSNNKVAVRIFFDN